MQFYTCCFEKKVSRVWVVGWACGRAWGEVKGREKRREASFLFSPYFLSIDGPCVSPHHPFINNTHRRRRVGGRGRDGGGRRQRHEGVETTHNPTDNKLEGGACTRRASGRTVNQSLWRAETLDPWRRTASRRRVGQEVIRDLWRPPRPST